MNDAEHIERILDKVDEREARQIQEHIEANLLNEYAEIESLSTEGMLASKTRDVFECMTELLKVQRAARVPVVALLLNRRETIKKYKTQRVELGYHRLYEQPEVSDSLRNLDRSLARADEMFALLYSNGINPNQTIDDTCDENDILLESMQPTPLLSLEFALETDSLDVVDGREFESGWVLRVLRCGQINKGNPFGARLVGGAFTDIDIMRKTTELVDRLQEKSLVYHLRINKGDERLRDFVTLDKTGSKKDELAITGANDKEYALAILNTAHSEMLAQIAFFKR